MTIKEKQKLIRLSKTMNKNLILKDNICSIVLNGSTIRTIEEFWATFSYDIIYRWLKTL